MRRNGVMHITAAGSSVSRVSEIAISIGMLKVPSPLELTPMRASGELVAGAATAAVPARRKNKAPRSMGSGLQSRRRQCHRRTALQQTAPLGRKPDQQSPVGQANQE